MNPNAAQIADRLREKAQSRGFVLVGIAPAVPATGWQQLREWLAAGYAGEMQYLERRYAAYEHPQHVLDGVRSLLVLALPYCGADARAPATGHGRVARYAWGQRDYHDVIHEQLEALKATYLELVPDGHVRGVVDTAPLLEREFAQRCGIGWIGKNTLLLNRSLGSYFFLAVLLVDRELPYDTPHATDHCGTCRACLDACPTQAFPQPYVLDASRCISYLTIELRGPVPETLREPMGDWFFGCDVCQEVCPWNHHAAVHQDPLWQPRPEWDPLPLAPLFFWSDEDFRRTFRGTPLWRAKRRGLLRNAAIVLGNQRDLTAEPALIRGLQDPEPLVRGASGWALKRLSTPTASRAVRERLFCETDTDVRAELT